MAGKMVKVDKKQHIQVFTRVRPVSVKEHKSPVVVETPSNKQVTVRDKAQTKTFQFDHVFGPESKQVDVYKAVVNPLIAETLQGYNCTVFAYGQTGTGKTYTMIGDKSDDPNVSWEQDPHAGIIPRTLNQLFDELKIRAEEFTVRVSFLEIYNEELFDLLAPSGSDEKNLKLYEDTMRRGSVIVSGLEERTVLNKNDVYSVLETGALRRQTASTLMNSQSSRSHTIFTITVHIKDTTPEGEELIKTGKLNLVDLAGSENIGRSGAVEMRAREAGNINQSLLTLGRVITSLVERTPHIPYRESKLTRILQDSLGGRTKTSIIATVSPVLSNIEETLSTLDYAHRAKNITNKPEINQKTSKRVLLKEYTEEIERLRRDLFATREKCGVYLAAENYEQLINEKNQLNKELIAKIEAVKVMEEELSKKESIMTNLHMDLDSAKQTLQLTQQELQEKEVKCEKTEELLCKLSQQTSQLLKVADEATSDSNKLHDKVEHLKTIEETNHHNLQVFKSNFHVLLKNVEKTFNEICSTQISGHNGTFEKVNNVVSQLEQQKHCVEELNNAYTSQLKKLTEDTMDRFSTQSALFEQCLNQLSSDITSSCQSSQLITKSLLTFNASNSEMLQSNFNQLTSMVHNLITSNNQQKENIAELEKQVEHLRSDVKCDALNTCKTLDVATVKVKDGWDKTEQLIKKKGVLNNTMTEISHDLLRTVQKLIECSNNSFTLEQELCDDVTQSTNAVIQNYMTLKVNRQNLADNVESISRGLSTEIKKVVETNENMAASLQTEVLPVIEKTQEIQQNTHKTIQTKLTEQQQTIEQLTETNNKQKEDTFEKLTQNTSFNILEVSRVEKEISTNVNDLSEKIVNEVDRNVVSLSDAMHFSSGLVQGLSHGCGEITTQIQNLDTDMDAFFDDSLGQDTPTGLTPQRKNFEYPKRLVIDSPSVQLYSRFKDRVDRNRSRLNDTRELDESSCSDFDVTITGDEEDIASTSMTINKENKRSKIPQKKLEKNKRKKSPLSNNISPKKPLNLFNE